MGDAREVDAGSQEAADAHLRIAARITPWFHEDDVCWIAEVLDLCGADWPDPLSTHCATPARLEHMHTQLARVAAEQRCGRLGRRRHAQGPVLLSRGCRPSGPFGDGFRRPV